MKQNFMEEEITDPDPSYLKGFNAGYVIGQEEPSLAEQLKQTQGSSPYLSGFIKGIEQVDKEKTKEIVSAKENERKQERLPDWMRRDRFQIKDDQIEKDDLEKDDLERE